MRELAAMTAVSSTWGEANGAVCSGRDKMNQVSWVGNIWAHSRPKRTTVAAKDPVARP